MNILPINQAQLNFNGLRNDKNPKEFPIPQENSGNLSGPAEITGRSLINFRGLQMHKLDKLFVDTIAKELEIKGANTQKLTQIVSDFIKENNIRSLSDIGGDEFINEQCKLTEKIQDAFKLSESKYEYLTNEIINRCDSKDDYVPSTIKEQEIENDSLAILIRNACARNEDLKYSELMANSFRLNDEEAIIFKNTILDFLKENNLVSLKGFAVGDSTNAVAVLLERLCENLNLSDNQATLLAFELVTYIHAKPNEYTPDTFPIDNDIDMFQGICSKNGYSDEESFKLFAAARNIAVSNQLDSIFEVFTNSTYLDMLAQNPNCKNLSPDFLIDLSIASKNFDSLGIKVLKHKESDNFYASVRDKMAFNNLKKEFGFSEEAIQSIYEEIVKRHPEHIEGGSAKDIKQIAFELADRYNLPAGAENKIIQIFKEVDSLDKSELDRFLINQIIKADSE